MNGLSSKFVKDELGSGFSLADRMVEEEVAVVAVVVEVVEVVVVEEEATSGNGTEGGDEAINADDDNDDTHIDGSQEAFSHLADEPLKLRHRLLCRVSRDFR